MKTQFGDRELIITFEGDEHPKDWAAVIIKLAMWLDVTLDVNLTGNQLTVKMPTRKP